MLFSTLKKIILKSAPSLTGIKREVVSRYRAFYHEIGNIEKCPFTYWLNGGGGFSKS